MKNTTLLALLVSAAPVVAPVKPFAVRRRNLRIQTALIVAGQLFAVFWLREYLIPTYVWGVVITYYMRWTAALILFPFTAQCAKQWTKLRAADAAKAKIDAEDKR